MSVTPFKHKQSLLSRKMNTYKNPKDTQGNSINPVLSAVFPLEKIREIALAHTKQILSEIGVADDDEKYAIKQYEMQFHIYHLIKQSIWEGKWSENG